MQLPYTDKFPEAVTIASTALAATLTAALWARPLRTRAATIAMIASVWLAGLFPLAEKISEHYRLDSPPRALTVLGGAAALATIAAFLQGPRWLALVATLGPWALASLGGYARDSDYELVGATFLLQGLLLGALAAREVTVREALGAEGAWPEDPSPEATRRTHRWQDGVIFVVAVGLALLVTNYVFSRLTYNGDEIANTYQASVYGHFHASGPIPPCASMFDNYWVFRHQGHAFSQYTPGWPLFMALFQRLGVIWLAGPVMTGIVAVGVARLARRLASGVAPSPELSSRTVQLAGFLGAASAVLGPSMLLNGGSRFSHPMVCACFAWAVESLCVICTRGVSRRDTLLGGLLLGAATSLGVATRPADGGMLGVGVFCYFVYAFCQRRISLRALLATTASFLFFGGLTAIILRLQLGAWGQTGYAIAGKIHGEAELKLSWPKPHDLRYSLPLGTGSYMWWPAAPALGLAGLVRSLWGPERRVAFILTVSTATLFGFYFFVEFGRSGDDGLGPRYVLPVVVAMAAGGGSFLAPLLARVKLPALASPAIARASRIARWGPALLVLLVLTSGVMRVAPLVYPVAEREYREATAPLRAARRQKLTNAIVMIEPGKVPAHETNLAQNDPFDPNPAVLFLIRRTPADETCARENFPGRTWYRAQIGPTLKPF
jgi:hypothetical protein